MRRFKSVCVVATFALSILLISQIPAMAVCKTLQGSHNGTDMFHPTGAEGAAINKLMSQVEQLKAEKGSDRVRMGRVRTKCSDWFIKYMLPHRNCVAKARVCY